MYKEELESGRLDPAHEQDYEQYFIVKETPVRGRQVDYNDQAIQAFRDKYAGFFAILTTRKMEAREVLQIYRNKDMVEKAFDDLKNQLDMRRLRMHSSGRMSARVFVQFIALILLSQIQKAMREQSLSSRYSPRLLLGELESLTRIHYAGKYRDICQR
jgi:transposase